MSSTSLAPLELIAVADHGVLIVFEDVISVALNRRVIALAQHIQARAIAGVESVIPSYCRIFVGYDSAVIPQQTLMAQLRDLRDSVPACSRIVKRWQIPVCYELGLDLEALAACHDTDVEVLIQRHSAPVYQVFMIGFLPGLAYIGPLDPLLYTPRRASPRSHTPAGCVNIGGQQALISSVAGPSGWHVLGRTPVRLFAPLRDPPFLLLQGDEVQFKAVDKATFQAWEACQQLPSFTCVS